MNTNIVRRAAVTTTLAAGMLAVLAGTAHASTDPTAVTKPAANSAVKFSAPETTLHHGQSQMYSTWFWGSTHLCGRSDGGTGLLRVQSANGADPDYMYIRNGE